jgi:hypothetical protein
MWEIWVSPSSTHKPYVPTQIHHSSI